MSTTKDLTDNLLEKDNKKVVDSKDEQEDPAKASQDDGFNKVDPEGGELIQQPKKNLNGRAVFCIILSVIISSCSGAATRYSINEIQINPIHSIFVKCLMFALVPMLKVLAKGCKFEQEAADKKLLWLRALAQACAGTLLTFGQIMTPQSMMQAVVNMTPLFSALIAFVWLGEKTSALELCALSLSLCMVITIVMTKADEDEMFTEESRAVPRYGSIGLGIFILVCVMPMTSFTRVALRKLSHVPTLDVMAYTSCAAVPIMSSLQLGYNIYENAWGSIFDYSFGQFCWLIFPAILPAISIFFRNKAFQLGRVGFIGLFLYLNLIFSLLWDVFFFQYHIKMVQIICMMVIIIVSVGMAVYNIKMGKETNAADIN